MKCPEGHTHGEVGEEYNNLSILFTIKPADVENYLVKRKKSILPKLVLYPALPSN